MPMRGKSIPLWVNYLLTDNQFSEIICVQMNS